VTSPLIRAGVGGWTFAPWRGSFYPPGLKHSGELAYASRQLTSIEINGTFYRTQTPASFRKWADETPDGFVFSVKGPRYAVDRSRLAESGPAIERFFRSGVTELREKLGPVLWQFGPTKTFVEEDVAAFLDLLPRDVDGQPIRHAVEARHESFRCPAFIALLRGRGIAAVFADSDKYPAIADVTGDFVYARLQRCVEGEPTGYPARDLEAWAQRFRVWSEGGVPADLPTCGEGPAGGEGKPRPCFVYFISGAKVRAPAAALHFLKILAGP